MSEATQALPWAPEAEECVLAAMMVDPDAAAEARALLTPEDFHGSAHRVVYRALLEIHDAGQGADVVTLGNRLKDSGSLDAAGGWDFLAVLTDMLPRADRVRAHALIVRDKAQRRRLILACNETARRAAGTDDSAELFAEAERMMLQATERKGAHGFRHVGQAVIDAMTVIERAAETSDGVVGVRTGIPSLDRMTAGLEPGGLTVLAGRPSMGKSALGWQLAERAAMDGEGVVVASYEMADAQLGRRGLARLSGVEAGKIRSGRLDRDEWAKLADAGTRLGALPIWTNDRPPHHVEGLRSLIQRHRTQQPTAVAIVDYLQQMSGPKGGNRNNEVEHISRGLKRMAMELELHVVALAQLNRGVEHRTPPRPVLSDLRDSGAVEQDADNVLLLWRPEYYFDDTTPDSARSEWQGRAELILAKQRDGETGRVHLTWDGPRLRFTEMEQLRRTA
jgi:replicative DNA helicase